MLPHDLRRRVSIDGTVKDPGLPIDPILVVGLHYKPGRHWRKRRGREQYIKTKT